MKLTKIEIKKQIELKLTRHFSKTIEKASNEEIFKTCSLVIRDLLADKMKKNEKIAERERTREVHYISMEFLLGRSLEMNCYNLNILGLMKSALEEFDINPKDIFDIEPDPGLGLGEVGILAACFMDSMATTGIASNGYSIRYAQGLFKQKIVDGHQVELPDLWLNRGDIWLIPKVEETCEVIFGGKVTETFDEMGRLKPLYEDYTIVSAIPYDMPISGYDTENVGRLRLWEAKSPVSLKTSIFSGNKNLSAIEEQAMAEVISNVLYEEDNHLEGQALRLKQQYFLVSATIQNITKKHKKRYGTLENFAIKNVIQINDTHPSLAIPELMRILMDEEGYNWEKAWDIVTQTFAYTNHTVIAESLECWQVDVMKSILPRILSIIVAINDKFCRRVMYRYPNDREKVDTLSIILDGYVKMANLCLVCVFCINGVSELNTEILTKGLFKESYDMTPARFRNITNGIAYRRWLCVSNPKLSDLISELLGEGFKKHPSDLLVLAKYVNDRGVLDRLFDIKLENKKRLAEFIKEHNDIVVDENSIFDVQVKKIHEYKRQLLNALHIVYLYHKILQNPTMDMHPKTFIFGGKASPGNHIAKRIINLINSIAFEVNNNPVVADRIKVVFIEDFDVSKAQIIIPATEISEQIALAGKEPSGTGNMKFMMNGALTLGTLSGANVEISECVGQENIFIFGKKPNEVTEIIDRKAFNTTKIYQESDYVKIIMAKLTTGFSDGKIYSDLANMLISGNNGHADAFLVLEDLKSYIDAHERANSLYRLKDNWQCSSLINIANSGRFASDRSVSEYAQNIWKVPVKYKL